MIKLTSTNPARNYQAIGEVEISTDDRIAAGVAAARGVRSLWKEIGVKGRIELLTPVYREFEKRADQIALLAVRETGRAITESKELVRGHLDKIGWFLDHVEPALQAEITHQDQGSVHKIVYEPIGVAAVITPWNHPFGMFVWGVLPNLLVGNPVVFKISEECPLVGKLIEEVMLSHHLPSGVFSELYGAGEIGWKLVQEDIDLIWFTGSTTVGQQLYKLAGEKFIKAVMELGGSNPCIVFEDAEVENTIAKIYAKRFKICGQTCDAIKRLIVHRSIVDQVVQGLKEEIEGKIVGDPEDPQTHLGSLVAKRQQDLIESQVKDAVSKGAKIVTGGRRPEKLSGAFYLPTLLTNVTREMRVWQEEVFGPVLSVISFETEAEAIELANDTIYGLGSVIFTKDPDRGGRVASKIDSGTVEINQANHWLSCNPFGGYKRSGIGREHGRVGFQELCQLKVISMGR